MTSFCLYDSVFGIGGCRVDSYTQTVGQLTVNVEARRKAVMIRWCDNTVLFQISGTGHILYPVITTGNVQIVLHNGSCGEYGVLPVCIISRFNGLSCFEIEKDIRYLENLSTGCSGNRHTVLVIM